MSEAQPKVVIIDDDDAMRESLEFLLTTVGLSSRGFGGGREALEYLDSDFGGCVLLDVRMPEMDGLEVNRRLREGGITAPVIMLTAFGEVETAVRAMREGAFDFVEKPCDEENLVQRIESALASASARLEDRVASDEVRTRFASLSARERDVMSRVVVGRLNKEIAADLAISVKTVETHRANIKGKLGLTSSGDLLRAAITWSMGSYLPGGEASAEQTSPQ